MTAPVRPPEVSTELFEPFVTSKPEGLGLGLPLVARAAERLGGRVEWDRHSEKTRFILTAKITVVGQYTGEGEAPAEPQPSPFQARREPRPPGK